MSYKEKAFYYLETGKIVYLGNSIQKLKNTLAMRDLIAPDDILNKNLVLLDWKEAKLQSVTATPIFISENAKNFFEKDAEEESNIWED